MTVNFDKAFGVHDNALLLFERRTQLLSENIANVDTPGFKAKDINFDQVLQSQQKQSVKLNATHKGHIGLSQDAYSEDIEFRQVDQSSADGNTVDMQKEKAAFAENTVRYQTTLQILSRKISGLKMAFRGE
jgi:flagellar basal-body rod protein FlgB